MVRRITLQLRHTAFKAKLRNPESSYLRYGPWANGGRGVKNRYLDLKFKIKGKIDFPIF